MITKASKLASVVELFKPDEQGISVWVTREDLDPTPLRLTKNGNQRHGVFYGCNSYKWETKRLNDNGRGKLLALRTCGLNEDVLFGAQRPIRDDIDKFYKAGSCVHCGKTSGLVTDHKNDLYNDPLALSRETQTLEDFQCLCNGCNLTKRSVSVKALKTGKRYGATNIPTLAVFGVDFISGGEEFDKTDPLAMVGTYWYDPVAFMLYLKQDTT